MRLDVDTPRDAETLTAVGVVGRLTVTKSAADAGKAIAGINAANNAGFTSKNFFISVFLCSFFNMRRKLAIIFQIYIIFR